MNRLEHEIADADPFNADFHEEVVRLWEAVVGPELQDLDERVRDNSGLRQLRGPVLTDAKTIASGAIGLGVALGSGSDIAGAVSAAAGIAGAVVYRHIEETKAIRRQRFYLLHATERRLRRTA